MAGITPEQALAIYLEMGADRSIAKLHQRLTEIAPSAPVLRTLKSWSKSGDWVRKAAAHDAQVGKRLIDKVETAQVKEQWSVLQKLEAAIDIALDVENLRLAAGMASSKGDFAASLKAAVEAIKLREVMTGGVSERSESKSDITVKESSYSLRSLLGEFVAAKDPGRDEGSMAGDSRPDDGERVH